MTGMLMFLIFVASIGVMFGRKPAAVVAFTGTIIYAMTQLGPH
jgi:hypothetical protein